jgi:hypothetical protein
VMSSTAHSSPPSAPDDHPQPEPDPLDRLGTSLADILTATAAPRRRLRPDNPALRALLADRYPAGEENATAMSTPVPVPGGFLG